MTDTIIMNSNSSSNNNIDSNSNIINSNHIFGTKDKNKNFLDSTGALLDISKQKFLEITEEIRKYINSMNKLSKTEGKLNISYRNYSVLFKYNYNTKQLKQIAKDYKLKQTGNKEEMIIRIYFYLQLSFYTTKIQKIFRGALQRNHIRKHGPGFKDRTLCTNACDFLTMDELTSIPNDQFFSFEDEDGFIYGFDILSLYNLIYKSNGAVKNPYNKKHLSSNIIENFRSLLRSSRVLKINIVTQLTDVTQEVSNGKSIELRALSLFQSIDALGNYTSPQWFMALNRFQLIKFLDELFDIWTYRANLSPEIKQAICYPSGNPFLRLTKHTLRSVESIDLMRKLILEVIEKMVTTGVDKDSKCLGAYYVLGALTLVNQQAANALPWLYEAAYHI